MAPSTAKHAHSRGATIVEFSLATVVILMLILAVIDLGRLHFFRSRLQYAVSQGTRFAIVGSTLPDPNKPGKQLSRSDSIIYMVKKLANFKDLKNGDVVIKSVNAAGKTSNGPGNPGDVVSVQATYRVLILAPYLSAAFPNGRFEFTCSTMYRNEEFSSSGQGGDNDEDSDG
jgi:Flp pilus assembly protein TadG